jgi:hypothetical protein
MSKKQRTGILAVHAPLEAQIVRGSRRFSWRMLEKLKNGKKFPIFEEKHK